MSLPLYQVDAFTDRPFSGNPAAVCFLEESKEDAWMHTVAMEMNLSETAFLLPEGGGYRLRWFTPSVEVDLCGHATLASAHILWETGRLQAGETAKFDTRSGRLTAKRDGEWIILDFPAKLEQPCPAPPDLEQALGVEAQYVGKNQFDYLIEVESEAELWGLTPDFRLLRTLPVRGVIVTCRSESPEFDFLSRFFAPGSGIDEDPVTGSAHCCLGPYWQKRLNKTAFIAYQASAREGIVRVEVKGDRVMLGGQAITVFRGELTC